MIFSKRNVSNVSINILFLIMFCSIRPWFVWNKSWFLYILATIFILCRLSITNFFLMDKKNVSLLFVAFFLYFIYDLLHAESLTILPVFFIRHIVLIFFVLLLSIEESKKLLDITIKFYSIILLLSILYYILFQLGFNLPFSYIEYFDNSTYPVFKNYYLFVLRDEISLFVRFQSIYLEPGHLGMISSFLLYLNKFCFRDWKNIVLVISIIMSFSLAAYILLLLGLCIFYVLKSKNKFKTLFFMLFLLMFLSFFSVVYSYNNSDSMMSKLIIERMMYDEQKGIAGNNRHSEEFLVYYESFLKTNKIWLGEGRENFDFAEGNSSYKCFVVQYGIIGTLLLFLFYFLMVIYSKNYFCLGFFLLIMASFIQRPYALWEMQICLFIASVISSKSITLSHKGNYAIYTT